MPVITMDFRSDNVSCVHPAILEAMLRANQGTATAYGGDPWSERLGAQVSALFEREVAVFPVATGTAANGLALSLFTPPWGAIYCHRDAHIHEAECGAPELFTGGAKLIGVRGADGKVSALELERAIFGRGDLQRVQPALISLSQASEAGTVYTPEEIREVSRVGRERGLALHMDGARFANALVSLGVTPAELSWKAGVDVLCLGATKNGAMAAEALVLFDREKARELAYRRKRAGQVFSKMRFLSAQLEAYFADDLWLRNARHANAMAARLAAGLTALELVPLLPVQANEVFVAISTPCQKGLRQRGFDFHAWPPLGPAALRLVTAFDTQPEAVDAFLASLRELVKSGEGHGRS